MTGRAAQSTAAAGQGFTSHTREQVLRRWHMTKLVALLPLSAVADVVRLTTAELERRDPALIATYLFAKANRVSHKTIAQGRYSLQRLLQYLCDTGTPWDGAFGRLPDLDLFGFLMSVHSRALQRGTAARPGSEAVWGALRGLTYLVRHFNLQLPVAHVRSALPIGGSKRGPTALLAGANPLPPEALARLFLFIPDTSAPRVLRAWAFALAFSAVSSLRQTNVQNLVFYGELSVLGKDFLLSQHANSKARNKTPTVFITPLQDFRGSRAWFDSGIQLVWPEADFLWADVTGDPTDCTASLLPCPLSDDKIQGAIQLVLQVACGMPAALARLYTKHSARKLLVSAAQAGGVPWEMCIELGHWQGTTLDGSFLLPAEDARRKRALECISMTRRYSHNARLRRVARIVGNQITRLSTYLRLVSHTPPVATFDTKWELMPAYSAEAEGA